jgi:coniferyl-aldehyde dehydrogenase
MFVRDLFQAQRSESRSPVLYRQRMTALNSLARMLREHKNEIVSAISSDFNGRAAEETLGLELVPTLGEIGHARQHLKEWMKPRPVPVGWQFQPARARIEMQAKGVVGILGAWNYPLFLTIGPAVGAIAAGNRVMIKPSELAPRAGALLEELLAKIFPRDYVCVVNGGANVAEEFSRLPFDHLLYTGSARVGKLVMKAAAENLTPVTLELGGKSPALVHPDYRWKGLRKGFSRGSSTTRDKPASRRIICCFRVSESTNFWRSPRGSSRAFIGSWLKIRITRGSLTWCIIGGWFTCSPMRWTRGRG